MDERNHGKREQINCSLARSRTYRVTHQVVPELPIVQGLCNSHTGRPELTVWEQPDVSPCTVWGSNLFSEVFPESSTNAAQVKKENDQETLPYKKSPWAVERERTELPRIEGAGATSE